MVGRSERILAAQQWELVREQALIQADQYKARRQEERVQYARDR